jgi:hypothetical protein
LENLIISGIQRKCSRKVIQQEMYDYIIVDEASQLGIDAMLLLYLTKKIIFNGSRRSSE